MHKKSIRFRAHRQWRAHHVISSEINKSIPQGQLQEGKKKCSI